MAVVVSKADALVEMVKAYDNQQIKKANKIGHVVCKSMQNDNEENIYSSYIGLDRETKQLFPVKVRKSVEKIKRVDCNSGVEIVIEKRNYEISVEGENIIIREVKLKK